jgi:hypothetical protein
MAYRAFLKYSERRLAPCAHFQLLGKKEGRVRRKLFFRGLFWGSCCCGSSFFSFGCGFGVVLRLFSLVAAVCSLRRWFSVGRAVFVVGGGWSLCSALGWGLWLWLRRCSSWGFGLAGFCSGSSLSFLFLVGAVLAVLWWGLRALLFFMLVEPSKN